MAAARELREETGITSARIVSTVCLAHLRFSSYSESRAICCHGKSAELLFGSNFLMLVGRLTGG